MHAFTAVRIGHFAPVLARLDGEHVRSTRSSSSASRARCSATRPTTRGSGRLRAEFRLVLQRPAGAGEEREDRATSIRPRKGSAAPTRSRASANTVFADKLDPANYRIGNAPVSYPYLWNIWKFDWVQYNASVSQPMARNVGEALGVGAAVHFLDPYGRPIAASERYRTSVRFDDLQRIESTLQQLRPPRWPEDLLGRHRSREGRARQARSSSSTARAATVRTSRSDAIRNATRRSGPPPSRCGRSREGHPRHRHGSAAALNFSTNELDLSQSGPRPAGRARAAAQAARRIPAAIDRGHRRAQGGGRAAQTSGSGRQGPAGADGGGARVREGGFERLSHR